VDTASTKMNALVRGMIPPENCPPDKLREYVPSMNRDCQGKSLRVGAANMLIRNLGIDVAIGYGNWERGYSSILEYLQLTDEIRIQAAKCLAGWPVPANPVYQARCDPFLDKFTPEQRQKLDCFITRLFGLHYKGFAPEGSLAPVPHLFFASLLLHHHDFERERGKTHIVCVRIQERLREFQYTKAEYLEWALAVQKDFKERNIDAAMDHDNAITELKGQIYALRMEVRIIKYT
jgi:hypothetical protein